MRRHGVELSATPAFLSIQTSVSETRLMPVLMNLVLNALQWTVRSGAKPPRIQLDAYTVQMEPYPALEPDQEPAARLESVLIVEDNGPGVPDDERETVFRPFQSGRGSSGIGLYICRRNMEADHHTVVVSRQPSKLGGAAFLIGHRDVLDPVLPLPLDQVETAAMDAVGIALAVAEGRTDDVLRLHADQWGSACAAALRVRLGTGERTNAARVLIRAVDDVGAVLEGRCRPEDLQSAYASTLDFSERSQGLSGQGRGSTPVPLRFR